MLHSYYYSHHYVLRPAVGVATEPIVINFYWSSDDSNIIPILH